MKKYIKASLSPSIPDWLRKEFASRYSSNLKNKLVNNYDISLDTANFQDTMPAGNKFLTFYLLEVDYGNRVYCPGVNDSDEASINGRYRKLGSIAKSKLDNMAIDKCYVDLSDRDNNVHMKRNRYRDPRYDYRYSSRGRYAGQYKDREYLGDGKYSEEGTWSKSGRTPSNERKARDKSGYKVPSPEEMIARYYERFPEKITDKLNAVYDRMLKVRTKLINADFNTPSEYGSTDLRSAYSRYGDTASEYQQLLAQIDESGNLKTEQGWHSYTVSDFSKQISYINRGLDEVEDYVNRFNSSDRR